jgi:nucleoside diphosphate kinase
MSSDPPTAASQGLAEADKAVASANSLGIHNSVIYYDLEKYATGNSSCSRAVQAFVNAWVQELHVDGFLGGVYGAPSNASADWTPATVGNPPDALWFAAWDNVNSVWDPSKIGSSLWVDHQRIHQFCSDGSSVSCTTFGDSFGGVTFKIDGDIFDGPVVPGQYLPAPTLATPANGAVNTGITPTFAWSSVSGASRGYRVVVATSLSALPVGPDFPSPCAACVIDYPPSGGSLTSTSYTPPTGTLHAGATYYWEVQARGTQFGQWSAPFSFSTSSSSGNGVTALAVAPSTILSGAYTTLTIYLTAPAGKGGAAVSLSSSNNTAFPVPSSFVIVAGQTSGSFQEQAGSVNSSATSSLTASYGGSTVSTLVTILPANGNVTTQAASSIQSSTALLNGSVNPQGAPGPVYFVWGTSPINLNNTVTAGYVTANSSAQAFSYWLSGLASGMTYYFQLVFYNEATSLTEYGTVLSFSSLRPSAVTGVASSVTSSRATISGTVNPRGSAGPVYFSWGASPTRLNNSISAGYVTPDGTTQTFTAGLSDLASSTSFYYQIQFYDSDNGSSVYGSIATFITTTPAATTGAASSITATRAVLSSTVNPQASSGLVYINWGSSSSNLNNSDYAGEVTPNSTVQTFTAGLSGLASGTTFYYQVQFYDSDNGASFYGSIANFTSLMPIATTGVASGKTASAGIVKGTVNPQGSAGQVYLNWGTNSSALNNSVGVGYVTPNSTTQPFTAEISGLASNTTFYYQTQFYDSDNGTSVYGSIAKFTTLRPVATTTSALSVTATSANLSGTVNPEGSPGSVYFNWGSSPGNLYNQVLAGNVTPGSAAESFNGWIGSLASSSTYYYQIIFYNSDNGMYTSGAILAFTTSTF